MYDLRERINVQGMAPYKIGFETQMQESSNLALVARGTVPEWLSGSLFRTGPGRFEAGGKSCRHWFDGFALLHRFDIEEGRVTYTSRFLMSQTYQSSMREGRLTRGGFATDPCTNLFQRVANIFHGRSTDNANVSIVRTAGSYMALTETPFPVPFNPISLSTAAPSPQNPAMSGHVTTAHPQYDAHAQFWYNYLLKFGRTSHYQIVVTDERDGKSTLLTSIPVEQPSYVHSFGQSEHYLVLVLSPLVVKPLSLLVGWKPFIENYRWRPELGLRWFVIDKRTGCVVRETKTDARFVFHHVNAFEEDGAIVADLITYPDPAVIDQLYLDRLRSDQPVIGVGKLERYTVPLDGGAVSCRAVSETRLELPSINAAQCVARPHRWVYGGASEARDFIDALVKIDSHSGDAKTWHVPGSYPGEPVFIPRPEAIDEDEGILLSVVLDAERETSFLLILDASTMGEIARAEVPYHIPIGTHGCFFHTL